ncbi:hypothetical protein [Haliangium sp.]|uniref:hypothetical protein n=1 Tax=Haliangium sp. TaxID=2663208 RepID=UPI003D144F94
MALAHTPLDPATLGPEARRALAPGPGRTLAARGLAPIPRPRDLLSTLYQLCLDADPAVREAAVQTAQGLPAQILAGALADPDTDPRVLDRFAPMVKDQAALMQRLLLNPSAADATIAELAATLPADAAALVAQNEERLLRAPEVIAALFKNPRARMSTVDRAVELAVRNQVKVPNIPSWDDLVNAVLGKVKDPNAGHRPEDEDALFERAAAVTCREDGDKEDPDQAPEDKDEPVPIARMSVPAKIRLATLGNAIARGQLIRDPIKMVAVAAIKAPGVTDMEVAKYASNHSLCDDVIHHIANRREWTKLYGVKLSLVQNPKTPIQASIRFMSHLREKDLRTISRSKGVPTAVAAQARKLLSARKQRSGGNRP